MSIEVNCDSCGQRLRVGDDAFGKAIRCPNCQHVMEMSASDPAPAAASSVPSQKIDLWQIKTNDGAVYGPVSRGEMDQWMQDGRINADTQLLLEGADQWQWAGEVYPHLAAAPASQPSQVAPLKYGAENPYQVTQSAAAYAHQGPQNRGLGWLLFKFDGRIPRRTYWGAMLSMNAIIFVVYFLMLIPLMDRNVADGTTIAIGVGLLILYVPLLWISLAVQAKRWHDRGKSGWHILIGFIPYIGGIWVLVECGCLRGTHGPNQYGPDPT